MSAKSENIQPGVLPQEIDDKTKQLLQQLQQIKDGEGYVYCLSNPEMFGIVKIGFVTKLGVKGAKRENRLIGVTPLRTISDRIGEIENEGTPRPFKCVDFIETIDAEWLEKKIHTYLDLFRKVFSYRCSGEPANYGEFFTMPVSAVKSLFKCLKIYFDIKVGISNHCTDRNELDGEWMTWEEKCWQCPEWWSDETDWWANESFKLKQQLNQQLIDLDKEYERRLGLRSQEDVLKRSDPFETMDNIRVVKISLLNASNEGAPAAESGESIHK